MCIGASQKESSGKPKAEVVKRGGGTTSAKGNTVYTRQEKGGLGL